MPNGRCLCGATKWSYSGSVNWTGYCHCESCRRNCAAPVTAFLGVPNGAWSWADKPPGEYNHTEQATRYFCTTCGTPMAYYSSRWPDEIHFYANALDNPESYTPNEHFHYSERLSWLRIDDDLKKHLDTAEPTTID